MNSPQCSTHRHRSGSHQAGTFPLASLSTQQHPRGNIHDKLPLLLWIIGVRDPPLQLQTHGVPRVTVSFVSRAVKRKRKRKCEALMSLPLLKTMARPAGVFGTAAAAGAACARVCAWVSARSGLRASGRQASEHLSDRCPARAPAGKASSCFAARWS